MLRDCLKIHHIAPFLVNLCKKCCFFNTVLLRNLNLTICHIMSHFVKHQKILLKIVVISTVRLDCTVFVMSNILYDCKYTLFLFGQPCFYSVTRLLFFLVSILNNYLLHSTNVCYDVGIRKCRKILTLDNKVSICELT